MPTTKTTRTKKVSTKKPTSRVGKTKLSKKSFFKTWMVVPIVLLVAIVGYAYVQYSEASSYSFVRYPKDIYPKGNRYDVKINKKNGTGELKLLNAGGFNSAWTSISGSQAKKTAKICTRFFAGDNYTTVRISVTTANGSGGYLVRDYSTNGVNKRGKASIVCTQKLTGTWLMHPLTAVVEVITGQAGISTIYGTSRN